LVLTGVGLFFDVAVRRIAVEPAAVAAKVREAWQRIRGLTPATPQAAQFLERLKSRKQQTAETIEKGKTTRRFDGEGMSIGAEPPAGATAFPTPSYPPPPVPKTKQPAEDQAAEDFASRLLRAKKKALENRDKEQRS
jgi:hypothetical protein